jgi:hypothetical protein
VIRPSPAAAALKLPNSITVTKASILERRFILSL